MNKNKVNICDTILTFFKPLSREILGSLGTDPPDTGHQSRSEIRRSHFVQNIVFCDARSIVISGTAGIFTLLIHKRKTTSLWVHLNWAFFILFK